MYTQWIVSEYNPVLQKGVESEQMSFSDDVGHANRPAANTLPLKLLINSHKKIFQHMVKWFSIVHMYQYIADLL